MHIIVRWHARSPELELEPIADGVKKESALEPEKPARHVHGVKVSIPAFNLFRLIFGEKYTDSGSAVYRCQRSSLHYVPFWLGQYIGRVDCSLLSKSFQRSRKKTFHTLGFPGCRHTTKHNSATWRHLQTAMGGNIICLGRRYYYTSVVTISLVYWIQNQPEEMEIGVKPIMFSTSNGYMSPMFSYSR